MRYVGNPETQPRNVRRNDADAEKALAQCRHGGDAASIPVLARKLVDNRTTEAVPAAQLSVTVPMMGEKAPEAVTE